MLLQPSDLDPQMDIVHCPEGTQGREGAPHTIWQPSKVADSVTKRVLHARRTYLEAYLFRVYNVTTADSLFKDRKIMN
jgi:hypothetical protein